MEAWKTALLLIAVLVPLFLTLNYFGLMVIKSGAFYFGNSMGTLSRFWGQYRSLNGYVSKNFWIANKYRTMSIQVEPVSGSADVEVLDQNGNVLHSWKAILPLDRQIDCRDLKRCKVRISSRDFAGKFLISLQ